jgi:hypothetical protein
LAHPQLDTAVSMTNNTNTARSIVEAFLKAEAEFTAAPPGEGDPSELAKVISPDCDLAQPNGFPFAGQYKGVEGFLQFLGIASQYIDQLWVSDAEMFEREGSNSLANLGTVNMRAKNTGVVHSFPIAQSFTVDLEKGWITRIRAFHWDAYALNKALGYTPEY